MTRLSSKNASGRRSFKKKAPPDDRIVAPVPAHCIRPPLRGLVNTISVVAKPPEAQRNDSLAVIGATVVAFDACATDEAQFIQLLDRGQVPSESLLRMVRDMELIIAKVKYRLTCTRTGRNAFRLSVNGNTSGFVASTVRVLSDGGYLINIGGKSQVAYPFTTIAFSPDYDPSSLRTDTAGKLAIKSQRGSEGGNASVSFGSVLTVDLIPSPAGSDDAPNANAVGWQHWCDVCACGFVKTKAYREHLGGRRHGAAVADAGALWAEYASSGPAFYDSSVCRADVTRAWSLDLFAGGLPASSRISTFSAAAQQRTQTGRRKLRPSLPQGTRKGEKGPSCCRSDGGSGRKGLRRKGGRCHCKGVMLPRSACADNKPSAAKALPLPIRTPPASTATTSASDTCDHFCRLYRNRLSLCHMRPPLPPPLRI